MKPLRLEPRGGGGAISSELLKTEFPLPLPQILEQLNTTGYWEGDMTQTKRDGAKLRVASRWSVRRDPQGNPAGYLEINTDISRRKQAEDGLRMLSGRLIQLQDEERKRNRAGTARQYRANPGSPEY